MASGTLRARVHRLLNPGEGDTRAVDALIITLIAANVFVIILETERAVGEAYKHAFWAFEALSSLVFTVEVLCRLWTCVEDERFSRPALGRLRYLVTPMNLVDMAAIAPFYLQLLPLEAVVLRAVRLLRLVRLLKMARYAHAMQALARVLSRTKEELAMTTFVSAVVIVLSSAAIYFAEHEAQPGPFRSIAASMWWTIVTLTSVGYGDVVPATSLGRLIGAAICLMGVGLVALPAGILASGFLQEVKEKRALMPGARHGLHFCPHCGGPVEVEEQPKLLHAFQTAAMGARGHSPQPRDDAARAPTASTHAPNTDPRHTPPRDVVEDARPSPASAASLAAAPGDKRQPRAASDAAGGDTDPDSTA